MMRGGECMKILKIKENKGFYSLDGSTWTTIDEIDKENLMQLVNLVLESTIEMDQFNEQDIGNQIIYKSIYEKLVVLQGNKNKFKDECDRTYLEAIERYNK